MKNVNLIMHYKQGNGQETPSFYWFFWFDLYLLIENTIIVPTLDKVFEQTNMAPWATLCVFILSIFAYHFKYGGCYLHITFY